MAFGTALYGFLGLLLAYRLARKYVNEHWAFLATVSIWWSSSLPVYMYFNPSWSHAHSAFTVALFLWYWHETCDQRTIRQWCVLAAISGLMLNVYYANAMILMVLAVEAVPAIFRGLRAITPPEFSVVKSIAREPLAVWRHHGYVFAADFCFPLCDLRQSVRVGIYSAESVGVEFSIFSPVLFSSDHGLFVWTPVVVACLSWSCHFCSARACGRNADPGGGAGVLLVDRVLSRLGRYFIVRQPILCFADGSLYPGVECPARSRRKCFQVLARGADRGFIGRRMSGSLEHGVHVSVGYPSGSSAGADCLERDDCNQLLVVPRQISAKLRTYLFHRANLMRQIEERDIEQMNKPPAP